MRPPSQDQRQDAARERVAADLELVRDALARYELVGSAASLDSAFAAAAEAIAMLRGAAGDERAEASEARALMTRLPEFDRLVSVAVAQARRSVQWEGRRLWQRLGLRSIPPEWDPIELSQAKLLVACACMPPDAGASERLRSRILGLAAPRWAERLTTELRLADDEVWRHALADRFESVHRRYAPRTRWGTRELATLFLDNARATDMLHRELLDWLRAGGDPEALPATLEAAFTHTLAPALLA